MLLLLRVRAEAVHVHQRRVHRVAAGKSKSKVKVEIEGSLLYTVVILCLVQCSIGKLWRSSTILSLAWHIITNWYYTLLNIYISACRPSYPALAAFSSSGTYIHTWFKICVIDACTIQYLKHHTNTNTTTHSSSLVILAYQHLRVGRSAVQLRDQTREVRWEALSRLQRGQRGGSHIGRSDFVGHRDAVSLHVYSFMLHKCRFSEFYRDL